MNDRILPKGFFKYHPFELDSTAGFLLFQIATGFHEDMQRKIEQTVYKESTPERLAVLEADKKMIEELQTAEQVVDFMRKRAEPLNYPLLTVKALSMQESVMPLVLRRYRTTCLDGFVEISAFILAYAEQCYAEKLFEIYEQIRDPYAQSVACLVMGMRKLECAVPLLLREYERMKWEYSEEGLEQGPLLGLYVMCDQIAFPYKE